MTKHIQACFVLMLLSIMAYASNDEGKIMGDEKITESYVMLYYKDLQAPRDFYHGLLGLEATYDDEWVTLYRINEGASVGIVKEGGTAYHAVQDTNAVMLSLTVDNADVWYEKLSSADGIVILKEIYNHEKAPIRAFVVADPGGYTIEVFQWLK